MSSSQGWDLEDKVESCFGLPLDLEYVPEPMGSPTTPLYTTLPRFRP